MGTHISKGETNSFEPCAIMNSQGHLAVKSIDLDIWTPEQMETIQAWGNRRANAYWEAHLKANHSPPEHKVEAFIRSKVRASDAMTLVRAAPLTGAARSMNLGAGQRRDRCRKIPQY